jgi:TRAP-type C4-dicarboxylate transport system permease small subunit
MLAPLERLARASARSLAVAGLSLLLVYAAATLLDGVSRAFGRPIDAVRDVGGLVVAVCISACFPYTFLAKTNISVTFIGSLLSKRAMGVVEFLASFLTLACMGTFAWQYYLHADNLRRAGEYTPMLEIRVAPVWYIIDLLLWTTVIVQAVVVVWQARRCIEPSRSLEPLMESAAVEQQLEASKPQ